MINKKVSIKVSIVVLISSLILISSTILTTSSFYFGKSSIDEIVEKLLSKTSSAILSKSSGYLSPANRAIEQVEMSVKSGFFHKIEKNGMLDDYLKSILASSDEFSGVYYGLVSGEFFMAKRFTSKNIASRHSKIVENSVIEEWNGAPANIENSTKSLDSGYDPRKRPWYKKAVKKGGVVWTSTYKFSSDNSLGVTRAFPIYGKDGELKGVFGIDIKLNTLHNFVKSLKPSTNANILIVNNESKKVIIDISLPKDKQFYNIEENKNSISYDFFKANSDELITKTFKGKDYFLSQTTFQNIPWNLMIIIPQEDFMMGIKKNNIISIVVSFFILLITILLGIFISNKITIPLKKIATDMDKVKGFNLSKNKKLKTSIKELDSISNTLENMRVGLKSFQKYVPSDLVSELIGMGKEAKIDGEKRVMTLIFTDITGFTSITEKNRAESLVVDLSEYLNVLSNIIMDNKGVIDKYIGDAIMAFWGAPRDVKEHAYYACLSAVICKREENKLMRKWEKKGKDLFFSRIGINSGELIVGNMGSNKRLSYTVLGDSVNLAARLESINKQYGTQILISQFTYEEVKDKFITRFIDRVALKGKQNGVGIYELVEEKDHVSIEEIKFIKRFEEAIYLYFEMRFEKALELFKESLELKKEDRATQIYIQRCEEYIKTPPPNDWDGVYIWDVK